MVKFAHILLILAVTVDINAQFFDFFSAFKPPTLRPIFEPTKSPRLRTTTERYQVNGRIKNIEQTTKSVRKTTKTNKQVNKKSKIDNIIDDGRNTINYDNPRTKTYTENPFSRPGVKPAIVNGPPITNKPPRSYVPRPIAGLGQNDDSSVTPELIIGPDEEYMTSVEKQRYIELAEKKCEEYASVNTVRVEAIPLVPSPSPVVVNVTTCARSVPLVVGGNVVTIQQFPHMALLGWTKVQSGGYSWKCGGSLVSERHVLTAAHCAYQERDDSVIIGPPRAVQLGSSQLDDPGAIVERVLSVTRHPKYRPPQSYNDIAVVTMANTVTFSSAIRPACLGAPAAPGDHFIATGWGKTEFGGEQSSHLRGVSLSVWSRSDCGAALGTTRKLPRGPDGSQTCAGERDGGKDTCQGDSGGPAQVLVHCSWRVLAVTSVGRSCGAPGTPALYANVPIAFVAKVTYGRVDHEEQPHSYNDKNTNNNNRQNGYNQQNSNSRENDYSQNNNNRRNDNNQQNSNSRENNYNKQNSNNGENNYNQQNSNNRENNYNKQSSNNGENNYNKQNSNNRENNYSQQNNNNRENDYNQQNNNNRRNGYDNQQNNNRRENDYNQQNNNNRRNGYDNQQNSNSRENNYSQQNNNNRRNDYNQQNSNNRENDYNNQNSNNNNQQNGYNNQNSNNRENNYNQQNNNNRRNDYNNQNSNSNNQQNGYNNQNSNSNNQQNGYNNQNSNSNNQQNSWKRTTTTPKWNQNQQSYDRRNNNYNNPYLESTEGYRRTDEYSTSRPQFYFSDLESPYNDGRIWRT